MPEPLTTGTSVATYSVGGITIASLFAGENAGVIIGAFSGSVIYILTASDLSIWKRILSFFASLLTGAQSAGFMTDVINYITPEVIHAEKPLGAVLASVIAVRVFMYISKKSEHPGRWFRIMKGGKDDR